MSYRHWLPAQAPAWLQDDVGTAEAGETGGMLDDQRDRVLQGILARFPTKGALDTTTDPDNPTLALPPGDAQDNIGADRMLPRAPAESDAAYGARLKGAWDTWPYAGSHWGVLQALRLAGYADMVIVQDNGRYSQLTASSGTPSDVTFGSLMTMVTRGGHPGWMFDTRTDYYSRFALVFTADAANLQSDAGRSALNERVNAWKPSKAAFVGTYVILSGRLFGWPVGRTFGTEPNLGGNSVRVIAPFGDPPAVTVNGP